MTLEWLRQCRRLADQRALAEEEEAWRAVAGGGVQFRYRWEHVRLVAAEAGSLACQLAADMDIALAAAWLHDIRKTEPGHGARGADAAGRFLAETSFPQHKIAAVDHAIRHHVGLFRPEGAAPLQPVDTAILWDADKLTKLGVPQIAALLSGPQAQGRTLAERLEQAREYVYSWVDRTAASMNTEPARELADVRYRQMKECLEHWRQAGAAPPRKASD